MPRSRQGAFKASPTGISRSAKGQAMATARGKRKLKDKAARHTGRARLAFAKKRASRAALSKSKSRTRSY